MATAPLRTNRLGVVIGNSEYQELPFLAHAKNDAMAFGQALQSLEFMVMKKYNIELREMLRFSNEVIQTWEKSATEITEIVIFYSGHGVFIDNKMYLVPVDGDENLSRTLAEESLFALDNFLNALLLCRENIKLNIPIIVILDCCRSELESKETPATAGHRIISRVGYKPNVAILYSTGKGQSAMDGGGTEDHSLYTSLLLKNLKDCSIFEIDVRIRKSMWEKGTQMPCMHHYLLEEYRFSPKKPSSSSFSSLARWFRSVRQQMKPLVFPSL